MMRRSRYLFLGLFSLLLFFGCGTMEPSVPWKNFAKSDIDLVADAHLNEINDLLKQLLLKLYKRNPRELRKATGQTIASRQQQLFESPGPLVFDELSARQGTKAILLAFDDNYSGDRVFAVMAGLVGMMHKAYQYREEHFMLDSYDQQRLYNSARNVEILVWRLSNKRDSAGNLFLLTNSRDGEVENLSYERLFGKMIALQDMMARISADKWNRGINYMVHSVAQAAFLPVGF